VVYSKLRGQNHSYFLEITKIIMSGHSKWASIKHKKGAADAKRANLFTKLSKNITVAARNGGDPDMNFSLRMAVDKARSLSMPKDNIERSIKKGTGELGGEILEEVIYEGYGPGGVALLIEGITDNKNRTTPEVRAILTKAQGSLGAQNSVKWMFEHKGVIGIELSSVNDKDELSLELIDVGAEDVVEEDNGLTIYSEFTDFEKVKKELEKKNIKIEYAEVEWVAKDATDIEDGLRERVDKIIDSLEEHDDVNAVFTNLK
jgi:YebC/PmpR family DNA-binding regulatory protein